MIFFGMIGYCTDHAYYKLSIISNVVVLVSLGFLVRKKTLPITRVLSNQIYIGQGKTCLLIILIQNTVHM